MKRLIVLTLFLASSVFAQDYQTSDPNVKVKNFECSSGYASMNIVNKTGKNIYNLYLVIFDNENDPIDQKSILGNKYVSANSGLAVTTWIVDCSKLTRIGFKL